MRLKADEFWNSFFLKNVPVLGILVLSGIVLLPVLLPIAATDDGGKKQSKTTSNGTFSDLDKLSMANIEVSYITFSWNGKDCSFCISVLVVSDDSILQKKKKKSNIFVTNVEVCEFWTFIIVLDILHHFDNLELL